MWSARYQLLPFSLARLSEPSAPAFTRALICVFFPALACAHGLQATLAPEGVGCSASHWAAADASLPEATAEAVCTMLSTALADSDEARQQLCHERFFEIAIENEGIAAASKHLNVVRALNKGNLWTLRGLQPSDSSIYLYLTRSIVGTTQSCLAPWTNTTGQDQSLLVKK